MECFINWCNNNQGFSSMILSVITAIISLYVMWKTNKNSKELSKKQLESETHIAMCQDELQRWQIKIATYPYRIDCWEDLHNLKEETEILKTAFSIIDYSELSYSEIAQRLTPMDTLYKTSLLSLVRFLNLFPINNGIEMVTLRECIIKNRGIIGKFKVLGDNLSQEEQQQRNDEKKYDITQFSKGLNVISKNLIDVLNVAERDLYIGDKLKK